MGLRELALVLTGIVVVCSLLVFLGLRMVGRDERRLIKRIGRLSFREKLILVRGFLSDRSIALPIRLLPVVLVLYLVLPLDLVPDFIPVLGQLDDLLILGLGIGLLLRLTPKGTLEQHLDEFEEQAE